MDKAIIVLAAGASSRFGSNKLIAEYKGKALFLHTLEKIQNIDQVLKTVVTKTPEIINVAKECGFSVVINPISEEGITRSLKLGLKSVLEQNPELKGVLFCVCDQPELKVESIEKILSLAEKDSGKIICAGNGERRGNPVYFGREYFKELLKLSGDRGGKQVIKKHPEQVIVSQVLPIELFDVDRIEDLSVISNN